MVTRNWSVITNGSTFESLVTTIVLFEDPKAIPFGRDGRDAGQDVLSGDGTLVYQAKHHVSGTVASVFADARREAEKIAKYLDPTNPHSSKWKRVSQWRLVTNVAFNPSDHERWVSEIVPLFRNIGLTADYWEHAHLDALIDKHPEIDRSFFQGETRVFLTIQEARDELIAEDPFRKEYTYTPLRGRDLELDQLDLFLQSDHRFLVVHGPGGIGKTRFLVEAGERIVSRGTWQVFWANIATMKSSSTWFNSIIPERDTILFVDEPDEESVLRVLSEQLGRKLGRSSRWKVIVSARSPKQSVLGFILAPRMQSRVSELTLNTVSIPAAQQICADLLNVGPRSNMPLEELNRIANHFAVRFSQHPIWLTLAVYLYETYGDLSMVPQTADAMATLYINEILESDKRMSSSGMLSLLRWIAILGTANREDSAILRFLAKVSQCRGESSLLEVLSRLVIRNVLVQRGARQRLVELKPDVIRDHILVHWLTVDKGFGDAPFQPSQEAIELILGITKAITDGHFGLLHHSILLGIARTESILTLSNKPIRLLDTFFDRLADGLIYLSADKRILLINILEHVAPFRPLDIVSLSQDLRRSSVSAEVVVTLFGSREVGQDDVVMALPWTVFRTAPGANTVEVRKRILSELFELSIMENEISTLQNNPLPNDGKRAEQLMVRVIIGGPEIAIDFEDAGISLLNEIFATLKRTEVSLPKLKTITSLFRAATNLERHQSWVEGINLHTRSYTVKPGVPGWEMRELIIKGCRDILTGDDASLEIRVLAWNVLVSSHSSDNRLRGSLQGELREHMSQLLSNDLSWTYSVLSQRSLTVKELEAARPMWYWHLRYDEDVVAKDISQQLESLYVSNGLIAEFEYLLSRDDWNQREQRSIEKARELADSESPDSIQKFIDRALLYFRNGEDISQISMVAWQLGIRYGHHSKMVFDFVNASLAESDVSAYTQFAVVVAAGWTSYLRITNPKEAFDLVKRLFKICRTDDRRIQLLAQVYRPYDMKRGTNTIDQNEIAFLASLAEDFLRGQRGPEFITLVGWLIPEYWTTLKPVVEGVLDRIPKEQIDRSVEFLVKSIYTSVYLFGTECSDELPVWLLDQVIRASELPSEMSDLDWHIDEILKVVGKAPLGWLPEALKKRMTSDSNSPIPDANISKYVNPITEDYIDKPDIVPVIHSLIELASDRGTVGYFLPQMLHNIDPKGLIVPEAASSRITEADSKDAVWRIARIGGAYAVGSGPWRTIAKSLLQYALRFSSDRERITLFSTITDNKPRTWTGTPGTVPQLFLENVSFVRRLLEAETDSELRIFFEWYLQISEKELKEWEEHIKEERGE